MNSNVTPVLCAKFCTQELCGINLSGFSPPAGPVEDIATVRKAVSNILRCLLANTGNSNSVIFFEILEAFQLGQKVLTAADKELCCQLVEEAYGSKKLETTSTGKAPPEGKEGGEVEATASKADEEEDTQDASTEEREEAVTEEGTTEEAVAQEAAPEGNEEEGVETTPVESDPAKNEGGDIEETVSEEVYPKPQEVAGAKKLFAKLSSGLVKDVSSVSPSSQDAAQLLDAPFWGEVLTAATAVSTCINMVGFDTVRRRTVEELSTSLLVSPVSAEKGANLTDMHRK